MKRLSKIYDKLSETYANADRFNTISDSHRIAIQQLQEKIAEIPDQNFIELGVGHGNFIQKLKPIFPNAQWTGVDLSQNMLNLASNLITMHAVRSSIQEIDQHVAKHQYNLVIAHYVCTYTGLHELLNKTDYLLNKNGYLSFVTNTLDSFSNAQKIFSQATWATPIKKIFSLIAQYKIKHKVKVPNNDLTIFETLEKHNYEIIAHERSTQKLYLKNKEDAIDFLIHGSWATQILDQRFIPQSLAMAITRKAFSVFDFPYEDHSVVDVILARKKS